MIPLTDKMPDIIRIILYPSPVKKEEHFLDDCDSITHQDHMAHAMHSYTWMNQGVLDGLLVSHQLTSDAHG